MKKFISFLFLTLSFVCLLVFVSACSYDDEPDSNDPLPEDPVSADSVANNENEDVKNGSVDVTDTLPEQEVSDSTDTERDVVSAELDEPRLEAAPLRIVDEEIDWTASYNDPKVAVEDVVAGLVAQNVYVGLDGWMFYGATIDDYTGKYSYSQKRLENIAKKFNERLEFCEENGIKLYFVVTPNKNSVYSEYMATDGVEMADVRGIDVVLDYLRENTGVTIIDCREGLMAAKESYPDELLYYKLDTHWNNHGGFAAYSQIMDVLLEDFPNAVKYTKDDYQIDYFDSYMKDEAYYLGLYDTLTEQGPVYTLKNGLVAVMTERRDSGPYGQFVHAYVHENGYRDKTDYCRFKNTYVEDAPSVYVIRDSFGISLVPFMKDSFSESTFSWTLGFNKSDILEKKPDIVIMQVVERSLSDFFNQSAFN